MKKILFIAVHPDDETLGCGGTILKHNKQGDEVYWLILTSIRNHPLGLWSNETVLERDNTIRKVGKVYGFKKIFQIDLPTMMLDQVDSISFINKVANVIEEVQPNEVYMMYENDVHSDHKISFYAVYSCLKSFRRPYINRILMFEALSETEFAVATSQSSFIPNVYVDISDYLEQKLDIMRMYDTELMEEPYPRSISSIQALARIRGSRAGVKYAEAFMLLYSKE